MAYGPTIPQESWLRTRITLLFFVLSASCTQPMSGRLAPRELPDLVESPNPGGESAAGSSGAAAKQPGGAPVVAMPPVPAATFTEAEVFEFVDQLLARGGTELAAVPPGTTLVDRLRYCLCRLHLDQSAVALPELQRLSEQHPDNPVVLRLLGVASEEADETHAAITAYRRSYDLDRKRTPRLVPTVARSLGDAMLLSPAHREAGIEFLREEIATGSQFVFAAAKLSAVYKALENFVECMACLDAGLKRDPDSLQLIFYKGLAELELHHIPKAVEILTPLAEHPVYGMETSWCLARAHFLAARFDAAQTAIDRLVAIKDLTGAERQRFTNMRDRILKAKVEGATTYKIWECCVILRGHPRIKLRLKVLGYLAKQKPKVASLGLKIASNSDNPLLRVEALRLLVLRATHPLEDLEIGFGDTDSRVRAMAAELAAVLAKKTPERQPALIVMVMEALAKEADSYAFGNMHDALGSLTGVKIEMPYGGAKDPEKRAAVVKAWRERKR